jgi:hypothetical protein
VRECNHVRESSSRPTESFLNNNLDIITCENEEGTCLLMDIATSGERIVIKNDAKKILKYKEHKI